MSYLGREKNYSECGFLGFNLLHTEFKNFINRMTDIYSTGEIFFFKNSGMTAGFGIM